jgi:hypothetical protein
VTWDGRDDAGSPAGAGLFFVRVSAGTESASIKLLRID